MGVRKNLECYVDDTTTTTTYQTALDYIRDGLAIIPVHGIDDEGHCTCRRRPCPHAGKHPVAGGWTQGAPLSSADAWGIWVEDNPHYNIGIRTGVPSGFFAVDVELAGLPELAELLAIRGGFPRTRVHATGGGGRHYLFRMPHCDVRNNQRKLGTYIDVRGTGGMIVAPPSRSGKGGYTVEDDAPIVDAPPWLLEWLSSQQPRDFDPGELVVIEDLPQYADLGTQRQRQCQRYAQTILEREAARYADAPPGAGNAALFSAACNILEVVQSPWNLLTLDDAVHVLESARQRRMLTRPDGGQNPEEFRKTFQSAQGQVIAKGRPLPPDPHEGLMFDPPASPLVAPGSGGGIVGLIETFVAEPTLDMPTGDPVDAMLAELLDREGLDTLPPPQPLIFDMLDKDSETWLVAPSGGFKSFVALDMAIHVGMGLPWRGKRTVQGDVVYIVAEGSKGIGMRVAAWEQLYGQRSHGVRYLPRAIQVVDERQEWRVLVEVCRRLQPAMIVVDTQARVTAGLEENSAKEMGLFVRAVGALKTATGACVLVVHHTGKAGVVGRGSSALYAAADTEIRIERPARREERLALTATIHASKQKDMEENPGMDIQMEKVELGVDATTGRTLSSLALKPWDPFVAAPAQPAPDHVINLLPHQANLLDALRQHANHEYGATQAELLVWLKERGIVIPRSSASTAMTELVDGNLVVREGRRFILVEHAL